MRLKQKYQYMIIAALVLVMCLLAFAVFAQNNALFTQLLFVLIFVGIIGGGYLILKFIRDRT